VRFVAADHGCSGLVALVARLGEDRISGRAFLIRLGRQGAGIRRGPQALLDLATGGRNLFRGGGFRPEFDDGSSGQVRHFSGTAVAVVWLGARLTRWFTRVRGDAATSADGRLSEAAIEFAELILHDRLPLAEAGQWIRRRLCADGSS